MAKRAMFTGADRIKEVFEQSYEPGYAYSIAYAERGDPCFQYYGEDHEKGLDNFNAYIDFLDEANNDDLLHLRFHPMPQKGQKPFIDAKSPVILVTPVRVHALGGEGMEVINGVGEPRENAATWRMFKAIEGLEQLPVKQAEFEARIMGLLEEVPEEAPVKLDKNQQYIEMAIGALKEPNVIANIQGLIKMFFPNYQAAPIQQPAISGTYEQQQTMNEVNQGTQLAAYTPAQIDSINQSLTILANYCQLDADLKLLADMAQSDPQQFQFLLKMLRK